MKRMVWQSLLLAALFLAATLFGGQFQQDTFNIGNLAGVDVKAAEAAFQQTQSNEDLVALVKALCWRHQVAEDETVTQPLMSYGQIMMDRAKAEEMDLEFVDDPEHMLQVLDVLRELGVK